MSSPDLTKPGGDKATLRALKAMIALPGGHRFRDPVADGAILDKVMPRLRRIDANFAIGMGFKRTEDIRRDIHPEKSGKGARTRSARRCRSRRLPSAVA